MNAKAAKDKFDSLMQNDSYIAQEKIDGVRALVKISKLGVVRVTTRGASVDAPDTPIDITHRIPYLLDWEPVDGIKNCIFDCEITIDGLDSSQIAGVVSYKSTVQVPDGLKFNVFDIIAYEGKTIFNSTQARRLTILQSLAHYFPSWMKTLPYVADTDRKYRFLDAVLSKGGEGIMLKNLDALYYPDKRPSNVWYKVKKIDSVDAKIVGAAPPEMYYRDPKTAKADETRVTKPWQMGWFGALVYELEDGTQGTVSGFDDAEKQKMSDSKHGIKPEYIGRYMELKFMEKTKDKKLRHPRFIRLREEIEK
jgi:ATP-dependent DNA ligase